MDRLWRWVSSQAKGPRESKWRRFQNQVDSRNLRGLQDAQWKKGLVPSTEISSSICKEVGSGALMSLSSAMRGGSIHWGEIGL